MAKTKKALNSVVASQSQPEHNVKRKPLQNKKKKIFDEDWDSDEEVQLNFDDIFGGDAASDDEPEPSRKVKVNRHLATFHQDIGLSPEEVRLLKESRLTRVDAAGVGARTKSGKGTTSSPVAERDHRRSESPDVIVFNDPTKRHKMAGRDNKPVWLQREQLMTNKKDSTRDANAIDLKAARQDVLRFGIHGLEQQDKQAATLEMLVRLGAKAPKRTCIGYKQLMEMRKAEKERHRNMKSSNLFDHGKIEAIQSFSLYKKRLNKKKDKGPVDGVPTGRHGVQKIKGKDIKKMGQSKNSRRTDFKKPLAKAR